MRDIVPLEHGSPRTRRVPVDGDERLRASERRQRGLDGAWMAKLGRALDDAQRDRGVRVILLDAEGPASCAGCGLDRSTAAQATDSERSRQLEDTVADMHLIGPYASTWARLHDSTKPTIERCRAGASLWRMLMRRGLGMTNIGQDDLVSDVARQGLSGSHAELAAAHGCRI